MTSPTGDHGGDVADEARRLVMALAGLTGQGTQEDDASGRPGVDQEDEPASRSSSTHDCGCGRDAPPAVCGVCPICRLGAFVEHVPAEAVDQVADLLGMVVGSLRSFADSRRGDAPRRDAAVDDLGHPVDDAQPWARATEPSDPDAER